MITTLFVAIVNLRNLNELCKMMIEALVINVRLTHSRATISLNGDSICVPKTWVTEVNPPG